MSPRGSSSTHASSTRASTSAPYSRRSSSQPKSTRQQFSACGACRMRRVRCDLKDLPIGFVGPHPACSNCKERGIKCVDEFADVKAVKLLRRGRRLQQVEAIYGKVSDQHDCSSNQAKSTTIPTLHSDFFVSPFWHWFRIQRPILDSNDFTARFTAHCKGTHRLSEEAGLIAMLLVTWASSFGLNEKGLPVSEGSSSEPKHLLSGKASARRTRKRTCETYVREILELVDVYGVLRKPSLDGVRALLLLLPLLEELQPIERLVIYETTMSQVQALCVVSASSASTYEEALTRARIFWYAYIQEGMQTGLRGGRFFLDNDDLEAFQRTLPSINQQQDIGLPSPPSPSISPIPNMSPYHVQDFSHLSPQEASACKAYKQLMYTSSVCLDIANICRKIHTVLTGTKATSRIEEHGTIDANGMRDIWRALDRCWQELEAMKRTSIDDVFQRLEISQFVVGWQIFIFECHNVIRETLRLFSTTPTQVMYDQSSGSRPSSHSSISSPHLSPQQLSLNAIRKCISLLPRVLHIMRTNTPPEHHDMSGLFMWDAGLIKDGCFFAACLIANSDDDYVGGVHGEDDNTDSLDGQHSVDDALSICSVILTSMRWAHSKSEEREDAVQMIWENRKMRRQQGLQNHHHLSMYDGGATTEYRSLPTPEPNMHLESLSPSPHLGSMMLIPPPPASACSAGAEDRPMVRPLSLFLSSQRRVESAPTTACSTDGHGSNGWPSYTPPGTATSVGTTSTGYSQRGSPIFSTNLQFPATTKGVVDEMFYQTAGGDMEQFSYNVPHLTGPGIVRETVSVIPNYGHHQTSPSMQPHSSYMTSSPFNSSMLVQPDLHACTSYTDRTYH